MDPVSRNFIGVSQQRWQNIIKAMAMNHLQFSGNSGDAQMLGAQVTYLYNPVQQTVSLVVAAHAFPPGHAQKTPQGLLDYLTAIVDETADATSKISPAVLASQVFPNITRDKFQKLKTKADLEGFAMAVTGNARGDGNANAGTVTHKGAELAWVWDPTLLTLTVEVLKDGYPAKLERTPQEILAKLAGIVASV